MRQVYLKLSLFFLLVNTGISQETMTLEKAISIGLNENFNLKIAEENIRIAENNNSWSRAGRGMVVDLNGLFSLTLVNDNNPASFINKPFLSGSLGGSLDANWQVLSGGRIAITKDQFGQVVEQQNLLRSTEFQSLVKNVVQGYYNVLLQQERLAVFQDILALSRRRLNYEGVKQEFGTSNSFALIQFEDAVIADSTNLIRQQQAVELAKKAMNAILTIPFDDDYEYSERMEVLVEELNEDAMESKLLEDSPTMKTLLLASELQLLNRKLEETFRKPSLSLNATLGFAENYFQFLEAVPNLSIGTEGQLSNRMNIGVGANLNWNLLDGGLRKANIESAKMQEEIAQLDILEATIQLKNQLSNFILQYNNEKELLKMASDRLIVTRRNLEMAEERFKLGQLNSIDYRAVQTQFVSNSFDLVNSMYILAVTKSEIDWLIGVYADE